MGNFIVIVLDGVGIGALPDAHLYNDADSNTLVNIAKYHNEIYLPNLEKFGLGNITNIPGVKNIDNPLASYGKMSEMSAGKDSTTGHWELGGIHVEVDFPYYPNGFPDELVNLFIKKTGVDGVLGNYAASGTEIIKELGDEHCRTGFPIIYTSADSVFQIAAHEEIIPLERLYQLCKIARYEVFTGQNAVGRIIARPFIGYSGNFTRTTSRKDYSLDPPQNTILDVLLNNNINTIAIGKINDLFNHRGMKVPIITKSNMQGIEKTIECIRNSKNSFIFTNLVDFDVYYGHRLDPKGFYKALQEFDSALPEILATMSDDDHIILTADHGNDPTVKSTDHTREYVPLLYYNKKSSGKNLGTRKTFADVAQTVAHFFNVNNSLIGESFLEKKY